MIKETIKNNKAYVAIIIILFIYLLFAYIFYKKQPEKKKTNTLIVTDNSKYIYNNKQLTKLEDESLANWNDYNIYINNKYIGEYKLQYNDKWYIYNEQRDPIKYEGNVIAFSNIDMNVFDYNRINIMDNEQNMIKNYLEKENITFVDYNIYNSKVEIDLDDDGKTEKIYIINSKINDNEENIFSMILVEKNNKLIPVISKVIPKNEYSDIDIYDLYGIIDIDKDDKKEIIISKMIYSQPDSSCEIIFKYENGKYNKLVDC